MHRPGLRASIPQIIPPLFPAVRTREIETSLGEEPLGFRESEREVIHTEVWRLHACKSVLGKFVFPSVLSVGQECTASHDFQRTDRQSRSPPENI